MKTILLRFADRFRDLADYQPVIALFLTGALLAVFLTVILRPQPAAGPEPRPSLVWTLYAHCRRWLWALLLLAFLAGALALLRTHLRRTLAEFQSSHGRITQANYDAVQSIWGAEQTQAELSLELFWEEEVTERIEFENLAKPTVLRKKTVRHNITANPFLAARHEVTLRQNPRKKGSAYYDGYETACRFTWRLRNPADRPLKCVIRFPLPADGAMYDGMVATLNGADVLPHMELREAALVLTRDLQSNEAFDLNIAFTSRGLAYWYFQVREPREIRDFTLTLNLPDLPQAQLNYPGGCMTPTQIQPAADGAGCVLTYRLDHAISNKGMGIALPDVPQPGATTRAVLGEVETGWLLIFALLTLGLTLAPMKHAVLFTVLFGTATACVYGLVGDFSDLLFGFWGTAAAVLLPLFLFLAWLLTRVVEGAPGRMLAGQLLLYGIVYPCLAGLDAAHQMLYFNLCTVVFLAWAAWQLTAKHPSCQEPIST